MHVEKTRNTVVFTMWLIKIPKTFLSYVKHP